jgi:hypothetical protein
MSYSDHTKVSQIRYSRTLISDIDPMEFTPERLWTPVIDEENIAYNSLFKPFSLKQYLYPRPPIDMGLVNGYDTNEVNVLRMPLKFPGTNYRVPQDLKPLYEMIKRAAEYETWINPDHDKAFCHITVDHSTVPAGQYHRYPGFHGDGVQGTKITPKINVEHSYILTNNPCTEFCLQPFFLQHLDEAKHNFFLEMDRQAKDVNIYRTLPFHMYLIDPYMVHRSPKMVQDTTRIFIRITYTFSELQHPKNTVNPLFNGQDYAKRVDIRQNLTANEFEVPFHLYGLSQVSK